MISQEQQKLVTDSFAQVYVHKAQIGAACYAHLFANNPEIKSMFSSGFSHKHQMLADELALIIRAMANEAPLPQMERLSCVHAHKGVKLDHFPKMREALLHGLGVALGDNFTPDLSEAWGAAFDHLVKQMLPDA